MVIVFLLGITLVSFVVGYRVGSTDRLRKGKASVEAPRDRAPWEDDGP